jgi:NADH-ubiquinone oxidoreductase chain 3
LPFLFRILIRIFLAIFLTGLGIRLGSKFYLDREKASPFECGFTPKDSARLPFSIRFFLISIIFLIFDVELILIFPVIPGLTTTLRTSSFLLILSIIIILVLGLLHEAAQGGLAWAE